MRPSRLSGLAGLAGQVICVVAFTVLIDDANGTVPRDEFAEFVEQIVHRPTELAPGAGSVHQEITTDVPGAQALYDQGLGWMHSYFWIEAARSFHHALRLDPDLALAELGLSRAYRNMGLRDRARLHLDRAQDLKAHVSEREQMTIEARAIQWDAIFASAVNRCARYGSYRSALSRLLARYPDDAEGWVTRGNASEAQPWGRGQLGAVESIAWYEAALARDPNHVGAHHFLLHAYENLRLYEHATRHAAIYAADATRAPHAQHMYGHVLPRVGRWAEALVQFERADALETAYHEREGVPAYVDWHHVHNLHLHGMALIREGRLDDAGEKLRQAFETPGLNAIPEVFAHVPYLEYLLHVGRYEEALEVASQFGSSHGPTGEVVGRIFEAEALLLLGRVGEAREAADQALADLDTLDERIRGANAAMALRRARSFASQLEGELALHSPDPTMLYSARQTLLPLARRLVNVAGFDGWGEGLLRLERMGRLARRADYPDLEESIREQIAELDPGYAPSFDMPTAK